MNFLVVFTVSSSQVINRAASPSLNSSVLFLAILYNKFESVIDLPPLDGEAIICTELDS